MTSKYQRAKKKYIWYPANGRASTVYLGELTLKRLQEMVGGYIERVVIHEGRVFWVNEEGLIKSLPKNQHMPMFYGDVVEELEI